MGRISEKKNGLRDIIPANRFSVCPLGHAPAEPCGLVGYHQCFQPVCCIGGIEDIQGVGCIGAHIGGGGCHRGVGVGAGPGDVELVPPRIEAGVRGHFPVPHIGEGSVGRVLAADGHVEGPQVQRQVAGPQTAGAGRGVAGNVGYFHDVQAACRIDDGNGHGG